jgi:hypothetical protein
MTTVNSGCLAMSKTWALNMSAFPILHPAHQLPEIGHPIAVPEKR